ncbi:uncharacterized protein BJ171DRAFT_476796 [Polychytrium aggregatum]|uniref:uncharacterized protein n=1 Tax=Polychytrium aggregatum TaxID=110093 RepID=UPI0022FE49CF|nr:uncharacterized protein BJ171DRAFT_476796 [Polychytrium aggregatum]KAI9202367.1 hypothetical protein BJ171DRAFT_476796 [Polychytrium aggregatum]
MSTNQLLYIFQHGHGLITFTSVLTVVILDQWRIKFQPKYLLQTMLYTDALAFCFFYAGIGLGGSVSPCTQTYLGFISDLIWAAKDGFKHAYLVWKVLKVVTKYTRKTQLLMYSSAGMGSFVIYIAYMAQAYVLTGTCEGNGTVSITWTLILLYLYWFVVDFGVAVIFIWFLSKHIAASKLLTPRKASTPSATQSSSPAGSLNRVLHRETFRVTFSSGLGFIVCILVVIQFITGQPILYINGIIFTMAHPASDMHCPDSSFDTPAQHILILSTVNNTFKDEEVSSHGTHSQTGNRGAETYGRP